MKITLDLNALVADGVLSDDLAQTLQQRALPRAGGGVLINLLLVFGAMAVAGGVLAFEPSATTGLILAATALMAGLGIYQTAGLQWRLLAQGLGIMGALGLAGWIGSEFYDQEAAIWPPLAITSIFAGVAWAFRSAFLAALATISLGAVIGSGTGYWHASYYLMVREPFITIALFGAIAAGAYHLRGALGEGWSNLSTVVARSAMFMVNFGFWVGSLWGDYVGEHWVAGMDWEAASVWRDAAAHLPEAVFSLGWAGVLAAIIWKSPRGSFLSISSIIFLAIHGYTQFFEILGAEPLTLLLGGVTAVGLAVYFSRRALQQNPGSAA
ncbi:MAG: hypothetical protein AAF216_08930 [Pseudomonadota bacterium]